MIQRSFVDTCSMACAGTDDNALSKQLKKIKYLAKDIPPYVPTPLSRLDGRGSKNGQGIRQYITREKEEERLLKLSPDEVNKLYSEKCEKEKLKYERVREIEEKALFSDYQCNDNELEYWVRQAYWSIDEFVFLRFGFHPKRIQWSYIHAASRTMDMPKKVIELKDMLERYVHTGQLNDRMTPIDSIKFMQKINVSIPDALTSKIFEFYPAESVENKAPPQSNLSNDANEVGTKEWRTKTATKAATARHSKKGGSHDKQRQMRDLWATGKYTSRDRCAEEECAGLNISISTARKALRNTPMK